MTLSLDPLVLHTFSFNYKGYCLCTHHAHLSRVPAPCVVRVRADAEAGYQRCATPDGHVCAREMNRFRRLDAHSCELVWSMVEIWLLGALCCESVWSVLELRRLGVHSCESVWSAVEIRRLEALSCDLV